LVSLSLIPLLLKPIPLDYHFLIPPGLIPQLLGEQKQLSRWNPVEFKGLG